MVPHSPDSSSSEALSARRRRAAADRSRAHRGASPAHLMLVKSPTEPAQTVPVIDHRVLVSRVGALKLGVDVEVAVSAAAGEVISWSIRLDSEVIAGDSGESLQDSLQAMVHTPAGELCSVPGVGAIRVPHQQAAMAADVMRLDSRLDYEVHQQVRIMPDTTAAATFLDPFYTVIPASEAGR